MTFIRQGPYSAILSGLLFLAASCASISPFSETAYRQAVELKVEALVLMDRASEPFDRHEAAVEALMVNARKAREYAAGRPKNSESIEQWDIMLDPGGHMLGGFVRHWSRERQLRPAFIAESKGQVSRGFDQIIGLESGKTRRE